MIIFGKVIDERFFEHRRRSTSVAGIAGGVLAMLLFLYRHYVDHLWNWDLLTVGLTIVGVKMALMMWFYLKD